METILLLSYTEKDGGLGRQSLEALTAACDLAKDLGAALHVGLVGGDVEIASLALGGCGAVKFLAVTGPEFTQSRYASDAAALEALCRASGASVVLAPADSRLSRAMPGVALRLGGRVDTQVTAISVTDGVPTVVRWYYRQRMFGTLTREQRPWILTLAPGCFPAYAAQPSPATFESVAVALPEAAKRTTVTGVESPSADEQTIRPEAQVLLVAGAGWTKKQADGQTHVEQAGALILEFLAETLSSLGSSKSLVDQSGEGQVLPFLTHLHQVGQTGATPRHLKGLATCCHGEEPHVVGWRFITERRAVNLDPGCGWAQGKADVLYVADAFAVMTQVNELLKKE